MAILTVGISTVTGAILAIIIGLLVLIFPRILNYAIAIYLILIGILQLLTMYT